MEPVTDMPRHLKPPTSESLAKAALAYLSRYAASEQALRRVLNHRLRRAIVADPSFKADKEHLQALRQAIDDIVACHKKSGALNDAAFAETKIHSLRRAGRSRHTIKQILSRKGVADTVINDMLQRSDDGEDPRATDLKAALQFAKKRKLGKFRSRDVPPDRLRKDLSAMARAGFSLDVAREALGSEIPDEIFS